MFGNWPFSQLQKLGSIATGSNTHTGPLSAPFPSSKSWAPLRPLKVPPQRVSTLFLFPAPKAGLHCDKIAPISSIGTPALFPAPKAGLHCDSVSLFLPEFLALAFPSSKSWAPLRRFCFGALPVCLLHFSQLQKLGSIATWPSGGAPFVEHVGFSQLQKLGSIATSSTMALSSRVLRIGTFSQLQKLGSIATSSTGLQPAQPRLAFPSSKSWAPLRRCRIPRLFSANPPLFPAPKAGLHCDTLA